MKEKVIAEKYGSIIIQDDQGYWVDFDNGEIAIERVRYQIEENEIPLLLESEESAYRALLKIQARNQS